ncbi:MAG TPA: hypothetical protein VL403_15460 [Candidatus Kryptonia bacterium]|nr:hypothetical protein [Candidatus Kryptonia bacterium]
MARGKPETVICTYRVIAGKEKAFLELLRRHWPTLRRLEVVTRDPPLLFRGSEGEQQPLFIEIFSWKSRSAFAVAHLHPEVLAIWEPMELLTEARGGKPAMDFPHVERVDLKFAAA